MTGDLLVILVLLAAAMVLLLLEVLTPTFGPLAGLALAALAGAAYVAFTISSAFGIVLVVCCIVLVPLYLVALIKVLPRTSLGRKVFLGDVPDQTAGATPDAEYFTGLVGKSGVAETVLRPVGMIRVEGRRVVATAENEVFDAGAAVKIVRAGANNVVVKKA